MEAFKKYTVFIKAYKHLKLQGKQARKALLNRELGLAAEAAQRNDTGQLHRIIRRLAPKTKPTTVRIHGPNGEMLREVEEHRTIVRHFETLFQSNESSHVPDVEPSWNLQVAEQDLYDALRSTKYGKAVPSTSAPSSAVKSCADILAQALLRSVNASLNGQGTPALWADCHLTLIPKPSKPAKRPENLRPLGLQDCGGKAYARLLKQLLLREVGPQLLAKPVFAYLPNRGTDDAIARVIDHCKAVRDQHFYQHSLFRLANVRAVTEQS